MEDVTRKRVLRKLEELPEEQLYQVLDYIEFLEAKYARAATRKPDPFQQFAERVEDQMRVRSLAPKAMRGTMRLMSTAGKVLDGVRDLGRDLVGGSEGRPGTGGSEAAGSAPAVREGAPTGRRNVSARPDSSSGGGSASRGGRPAGGSPSTPGGEPTAEGGPNGGGPGRSSER